MRTLERTPLPYLGRRPESSRGRVGFGVCLAVGMALGACDGTDPTSSSQPESPPAEKRDESGVFCRIPLGNLFSSTGPDAIPALTNPPLVAPDDEEASYLTDDDRVVGLLVDGAAFAFPLDVLRWHENVNIDVADEQLAVSYCPLTGTALTFDRFVAGEPVGQGAGPELPLNEWRISGFLSGEVAPRSRCSVPPHVNERQ